MKTIFSICLVLITAGWMNAQDNALQFDGNSQYVQVPHHATLNPDIFTLSFWAYIQGGQGTKRSVVTSQNTSGTNDGYALYLNSSNKWEFWIGTSTGPVVLTSTVEAASGWSHISATFDGSTLRIFENGVNVSTSTGAITFSPNTVSQLSIAAGGDAGTETFFIGMIDELRIWNVVRTQEQIRDLMYVTISGTDPELGAYYRMNGLSNGDKLFDRSTNTNHGIIQNMTEDALYTSSAFYGPKLALSFDGVDDYVDFGPDGIYTPTSANFTLEAWVYPTHDQSDPNYHYIFGCEQVAENVRPPFLAVHGNNVYSGFGDGTDFYSFETSDRVSLDTWNHIAVTYNGSRFRIYINGFEYEEYTLSGKTPATSNPIRYFGKLGDGGYFEGIIDEARIWNTARHKSQIVSYYCTNLTTDIEGLVRYCNMDMGTSLILPEYVVDHDGDLINFNGNDHWVVSSAFTSWLNTDDPAWDAASNWSGGTVPGSLDFAGVQAGNNTALPIISSNVSVKSISIDFNTSLTINSGIVFNTLISFFLRGELINDGTNQVSGLFQAFTGVWVYTDNGTTEYNGSLTQNIELPRFNNLIINNTGDSVYSLLDSLFVEGDFTVETGKFSTPLYMNVSGNFTMETATDLHVMDITNLDIMTNFIGNTENDLVVDGYGVVYNDLSLNSNVVGNGTLFAQTYTTGDFTVFGRLNPPNATFFAAYNWDSDAANNDWNDGNNWSNGKVPGKGTDVTIEPGAGDENYPQISSSVQCKSLTLNAESKLFIKSGGALGVNMSLNLYNNSELNISVGSITTDHRKKGTADLHGGNVLITQNGQFNIEIYMKMISGSTFSLDAGAFSIGADLTIDGSTVTIDNNGYGLVVDNVIVGAGSEVKLENGSHLDIGGASTK